MSDGGVLKEARYTGVCPTIQELKGWREKAGLGPPVCDTDNPTTNLRLTIIVIYSKASRKIQHDSYSLTTFRCKNNKSYVI